MELEGPLATNPRRWNGGLLLSSAENVQHFANKYTYALICMLLGGASTLGVLVEDSRQQLAHAHRFAS